MIDVNKMCQHTSSLLNSLNATCGDALIMHIEMASFQALNAFLFVFVFKYISKSDNNFRKSVMICQITDSVDNHFGEYL